MSNEKISSDLMHEIMIGGLHVVADAIKAKYENETPIPKDLLKRSKRLRHFS